jgi:flagellar hook protein FlgE
MGLTSALNTSLIGLTLNETAIDVVGNNIANAGTNGFKASTVLFATQLSRTLSIGSAPTATDGGTNPRQIGLGALVAAINKNFAQGGITNGTNPSDLAIQGDGFFIVEGPDGDVYTRDGSFALNSQNLLVNNLGLRVQGFGVDSDFNIISTQLTDISIPVGNLIIAQQTDNIALSGALLSTGEAGTQGTLLLGETLTDGSTSANATSASLLSDIQNAGGTNLFTVGQTLSFSGEKGGRRLDPLTLLVTAGTTLGDLTALMDQALGLHSGGTIPDDPNNGPAQPGVDIVGGQIRVTGNRGTVNDLNLSVGDLTSNGTSVPLSFTKQQTANGESAITDFIVFDSLGEPVTVKMTAVLESQTSTATFFRYFLESADDSDNDSVLADGVLEFDGNGQLVNGATATFSIDRNSTAAISPMQISADFSRISGIAPETAGSTLALAFQDGTSPTQLASFDIDENGFINGIFDNGTIRTLGQIVLARFANNQGLVEDGNNTFREGVASGPPLLATPGNFGVGTVRSGAIELSNTDIGRELVNLLVASTNYRGNARVISSVQQLVDELLLIGR